MKLPNVDRAIVPQRKIVDYLLSKSHPDRQPKAVFFQLFGFTVANWQDLEIALRDHAIRGDVSRVEDSPFGTRYVIEGIRRLADRRVFDRFGSLTTALQFRGW